MNKPTLFLHLGMSKTGSTYLQKEVFPKIPTVDFFYQPMSDALEGGRQGILARAFKRSPVIWRRMGDEIFSGIFQEPKNKTWARIRNVLISDQSAGPQICQLLPYLGSRWEQERQDPFLLGAHLEELSALVSKWGFGKLKVILVFRRQDEWMASKYAQRSDRFPNASQSHFEKFVDYLIDPGKGFFSDGIVLDYKLLREQLIRAIGEENILMLPYELLVRAAGKFLHDLVGFVDTRDRDAVHTLSIQLAARSAQQGHNVRSKEEAVWTIRDRIEPRVLPLRPGRILSTLGLPTRIPMRWPEFKRGTSIRLNRNLRETILEAYIESNEELAADIDYNLHHDGYY
jgi:hypothetical protein